MMTTLDRKEGSPIIDHGRKRSRNGTHAIMAAIAVAVAAVTSGCTTVTDTLGKRENATKTGISPEQRQQAEVLLQQVLERYKDNPLLYDQVLALRKRLEYLFSSNFLEDAKRAGLEPNILRKELCDDLVENLRNPEKSLPEEIIRKQLFAEISPHLNALVDQYTEECKTREKMKEKEENPHTKRLRELIDAGNRIGSTLLRNNFDTQEIRRKIAAFKGDADAAIAKSKANAFVRSAK